MQQSRSKLTKAQWQRLEPLRPGSAGLPDRKGFSNRKTGASILVGGRPLAGAPGTLGG